MEMIRKKVGSITLAVGLITVGALLFAQNFIDISIKDIYKYWPVLLIGLGLEMILYMVLYGRSKTEVKLSVDGLCIVFIIVLGLISNGIKFINIDIDSPRRYFFGSDGGSVIDGFRYKTEISEKYNKDNISSSFDVKTLKVTNDLGDIKVLPADGKSIRLESEVTVKCNDENKAREYAQNAIEIIEGEITEFSIKSPANRDKNDYARAQVDFVIYVPKEVNLIAEGSFGDIEAEGISGECRLENKNGEITASDIGGDVDIDNSFGNIEVSSVGGKADITNNNGEISAADISGSAVIENHFGDIEAEKVGGDLKVVNNNGRIEVKEAAGNAQIKNAFGDIYFKSASIDNGDIYAKTKFGSINCKKPLQVNKEGQDTVAQGRLGTGQYRIELTTDNGSINID